MDHASPRQAHSGTGPPHAESSGTCFVHRGGSDEDESTLPVPILKEPAPAIQSVSFRLYLSKKSHRMNNDGKPTANVLERYSDRFPGTRFLVAAEFMGTPGIEPETSHQADLGLEF